MGLRSLDSKIRTAALRVLSYSIHDGMPNSVVTLDVVSLIASDRLRIRQSDTHHGRSSPLIP
jgi:hypothetical protein